MKNINLFLDDIREPWECGKMTYILHRGYDLRVYAQDWSIVRSYDEFVDFITKWGLPDLISFDHDLADAHYGSDTSNEKTGYNCAKWLIEYCHDNGLKLPKYQIHSANPVGYQNIRALLKRYEEI